MLTLKSYLRIIVLILVFNPSLSAQITVENLGHFQGGISSKGLSSFAFHENYAYVLFTTKDNMGRIMRYNLTTGSTDLTDDLFPTIAKNDASHNGSAIAVDGEGYIHAWIAMHNHPMKYYRSIGPGTYNNFSENIGSTMNYNGAEPEAFTYPNAATSSNGDVFLILRNNGPRSQQNETQWFYHLDKTTDTWKALKIYGKTNYNAYMSHLYADKENNIHIATAWSKYHDGPNTFQKGTYMKYNVDTQKFFKADGTDVTHAIPIAHDDIEADVFYLNQLPWATDPDDDDTEEIQTPRVCVTKEGHPIVSYSQSQDNGVGKKWNAQIVFFNGTQWLQTKNVIEDVNKFARTDITYTCGRINLFERIKGKIHIISSENNGATFDTPVIAKGTKIPSDALNYDTCSDLYLDSKGLYKVQYSKRIHYQNPH